MDVRVIVTHSLYFAIFMYVQVPLDSFSDFLIFKYLEIFETANTNQTNLTIQMFISKPPSIIWPPDSLIYPIKTKAARIPTNR